MCTYTHARACMNMCNFVLFFNLIGSHRDLTFIDSADGWWQHLYQGCLGRCYFTSPDGSASSLCEVPSLLFVPSIISSGVSICLRDIVGIGQSRENLTQFIKNTKSLNILDAIETHLCFCASDLLVRRTCLVQ